MIEVDGDTHAEAEDGDAARTAVIEAEGYRVVRFTNSDVMRNLDGVLSRVAATIETDKAKGNAA